MVEEDNDEIFDFEEKKEKKLIVKKSHIMIQWKTYMLRWIKK